jgi:hypothetical protein
VLQLFCTPQDRWRWRLKHVEQLSDNINSVTCAACWDLYIRILLRCRDPWMLNFTNVYTISKRWTCHVGFGWFAEETNSAFLKYDLRANHCGYLLVVMWDFRWIIASDLLVLISLNDLPQRAVVRPYLYLRALFFYVTVVGWALWFRRIQICHALDMILSLKKSTFEKCNCFCYIHRLIFTGHNLIVGLSEMRVFWFWQWQNLCVQFFSFFISCFCRTIFKMPYANCTVVQLGLCRLGEG